MRFTAGVKLLVILVAALLFTSCEEDTISPEMLGSIMGEVVDGNSGAPLAGASISTNPPTSALVTDSSGKFSIENISEGDYSIAIYKSGYKKLNTGITVKYNTETDAKFVLEETIVTNEPPLAPSNPIPADEDIGQLLELTIAWESADPDSDEVKYDVYLYKSNSPVKNMIVTGIVDTSTTVSDLQYNTTYYWQVIASDSAGNITHGPVWSFETEAYPSSPIVFAGMNGGNYEIFTTDSSAANIIKLTTSTSRNWWPRFSPKGDKIAFVSDRNNEFHIFTMNTDGTGIKKITTRALAGYHNNGLGFTWSHNGDYLLYANYDKLYRINADGTNMTLIATAPAGKTFRECTWSPLGNKIAVLTIGTNPYQSEIYTMNTDGSNAEVFVTDLPGSLGGPVFYIDGKSIMFTRDIHEVDDPLNDIVGRQLNSQIIIMSLDKSDTINVSSNKAGGTNDFYPRFSPDGSKIIFTNAQNDNSRPDEVWIMALSGNDRRRLISGGLMPDWR